MAWRLWGGKVGIVDLFGVITGKGQAAEQVRLLNRLKESRRFKAVVINIDSPGGLATASKQSMLQRLLVRGPDAGALLPAELDWLIASQVLFLGPGA